MLVDILIPCIIDQFYPKTGFNFVKVLEKAGCAVNYNTEQTCCGKVAYDSGYWDDCKEIGSKLIKEFVFDRYIVSPSTACSGMIKHGYQDLFFNSVLHNEYKQVQRNIWELSDFLVKILKVQNLGSKLQGKAILLQNCENGSCAAGENSAEILLKQVEGLTLLKPGNSSGCCGFSGIFSVKNEPLSVKLSEEKIESAIEAGADYLIVTEPGCFMQLHSVVKQKGSALKIMHLADVLSNF